MTPALTWQPMQDYGLFLHLNLHLHKLILSHLYVTFYDNLWKLTFPYLMHHNLFRGILIDGSIFCLLRHLNIRQI